MVQPIMVGAGQYSENFTSIEGFDSIVTTNLSFYQTLDPVIVARADTLISLNTYQKYQWYDTNGAIDSANENRYVINKSGEYYLLITDNNGCSKSSEAVNVYHTYSIHDTFEKFKYSVIPNPNNGKFSLKITNILGKNLTLKLMNSVGRDIEVRKTIPANYNYTERFDISYLGKGIYYLVISDGSTQQTKKIMVQ